ncbi:MAG: DUF1848 domain-containing protein [Desulfobacterales bacterium]|nr:DUF1848 domain-containing protein [Desulfobacterales bacterium]
MTPQIVISASRRTDIPAFYMDWFMERIRAGSFELINPFNGRKSLIIASPDHVHTIVFWSKDFSRFIAGDFGRRLREMGYHLFFNFTINSESPLLEPGIPPLKKRFRQAAILCETFGPSAIQWRFDPICFYTVAGGRIQNNFDDFPYIADHLATLGIKHCITSFMDHYNKIGRRCAQIPGLAFVQPPVDEKIKILAGMQSIISPKNMKLYTCCEKEVLDGLPPDSGITPSSCIPNRLLVELFGGALSLKKDQGQRVKQGCGCFESKDIGLYRDQPCFHNCLFCYANPASDGKNKKT